jgi:hypothetical protein
MSNPPGARYEVFIMEMVGGRRGSRSLLITEDEAEAESLAESIRQDGEMARVDTLPPKRKR